MLFMNTTSKQEINYTLYKIFLIFIFFIITTNLLANNHVKKLYGGSSDWDKGFCKGFCEDERHDFHIASSVQKKQRIVNGKKKNTPTWIEFNGTNVKDTPCAIFTSYNERIVPLKMKKKDKEKNRKDFRDGSTIIHANYNINSCVPCPAKHPDTNKTGFCSISSVSLDVFFTPGIKEGFIEEVIDLDQVIVGRASTGDKSIDRSESLRNIYMEMIKFPESHKSNIAFIRIRDYISGDKIFLYQREKFKTSAKQSLVSTTKIKLLEDKNIEKYLNELIRKFQTNFYEAFKPKGKNFENIDILFDLIPTNSDVDILSSKFKNIKKYYVQTRD